MFLPIYLIELISYKNPEQTILNKVSDLDHFCETQDGSKIYMYAMYVHLCMY